MAESKDKTQFMLTTIDNPYNPFTEFDKWNLYDVEKGYNTCCLLARIAKTSEAFTTKENEAEIDRAIDEIIENDFLGMRIKVDSTYFDRR